MILDEAIGRAVVSVALTLLDPKLFVDCRAGGFGGRAGGTRQIGVQVSTQFGDDVQCAHPEPDIVGNQSLAKNIVGPVAVVPRLQRQCTARTRQPEIALDDRPYAGQCRSF